MSGIGIVVPSQGEDITPIVVPENVVYEALLEKVDERAKRDGKKFWLWTFEIISGQQRGKKINGYSDAAITSKNKTARWLAAVGVTVEVTKGIDMDKIVNRPCNISTKTNDRTMPSGKVLPSSSVDKVYSPNGKEPAPIIEGPAKK